MGIVKYCRQADSVSSVGAQNTLHVQQFRILTEIPYCIDGDGDDDDDANTDADELGGELKR